MGQVHDGVTVVDRFGGLDILVTSAGVASEETAAEKYGWLNRIIAVGLGHREPQGPIYRIFEVL